MADALGIELHPDVLPFGNMPAYLPPFLLAPDIAMTLAVQVAGDPGPESSPVSGSEEVDRCAPAPRPRGRR